MSRRRSTGDLVPRDITEILAREARAQRGQRKPGSSLGGAFSWLKGSRRKKNTGNGLTRNGSAVTDAKLGLQNHDLPKAGPKVNEDQKRLTVHYTASQHYQENVFIEGSRPQYLEDLHTEAQEGLKIQQQEALSEHKNGVNFPDDESIASTDTLRPEKDISSKDGNVPLESKPTSGNIDSTVTFAGMTRPLLTHQGSTFKPLNPVKRLDKSRKRTRRTTIMGIPNQVQKELALNRSSTFQPLVSTKVSNSRQISDSQSSGVVIISTVDGTPVANTLGARVHLSELENAPLFVPKQTFRDEELVRKHLQAVDEQSFNQQDFGSHFCPTSNLRPKSLAVPSMTTSTSFSLSVFNYLQEPQGPVMSVSPQATYLSTIIPNAVLPASVEVIEIDRSNSRSRGSSVNHGSSVHTVSKSSLTSGDSAVSPLLSRRSDSDSSQTNNYHNDSTLMATSASGSSWSESKSSETIISNPSPLSSKSSAQSSNSSQRVCLNGQECQAKQTGGDQDLVSFRNSVSVISNPSNKSENLVAGPGLESGASGAEQAGELAKNKKKRSLSVMKTKQPPAPPRRTNSLHGNKIRGNSRVAVDSKGLKDSASGEVTVTTANKDEAKLVSNSTKIPEPVSNLPGSNSPDSSTILLSSMEVCHNEAGETETSPESSSSPQKISPEEGKFERTISPSSGYSSQSGTPTLSPKGIPPASPDKQKKKPVKPERSASRASSSAASPSSSVTSLSSGTSELTTTDVSLCSPNQPPQGSSPTVATKELALKDNSSTLTLEVKELLNIPPPPKVKAPCPPPPETWVHNRHTFELLCGPCPNVKEKAAQIQESTSSAVGTQTETRKEIQVLDEIQTLTDKPIIELSENKAKPEEPSSVHPDSVHMGQEGREYPEQATPLVQDIGKASVDVQQQEQSDSFAVKEPESRGTTPKKEPPPVMKKPVTVLHRGETVLAEKSLEKENNEMNTITVTISVENNTSLQNGVIALAGKSETEMDRNEAQHMQRLSIEVPKINKISPPPTPPPAYHPTPPPSRKTPPSSVSTPPNELQRVQEEIHVAESSWPPPPPPLEGDSVFDGVDEADFPPPPPPSFIADSASDVLDGCITELGDPNVQTVQSSNLLPAIPEPVINDVKPVIDMQVSKPKPCEEISCQVVQNISSVSEIVSPSPVELPLTPTIRKPESPVSNTAVVPLSSFQKRGSLQIEDLSVSISTQSSSLTVPVAPHLSADNLTHGVTFRRHPSLANRDAKTKEFFSRHKSAPIPKEDANIPLVTPSLLQMVRLRSVNMTEDQVKCPLEDKPTNEGAPVKENCPVSIQGSQNIPQKPIRKSLSLKSPPQVIKTSSVTMTSPSMRLQEAIRMKTAAMSSRDGLPSRLGVKSPTSGCVSELGATPQKSHEGYDMHKSPASTASFIFSRSTKKVVIETATSPEAQASLKQSLTTELMQVSDQSKVAAFSFDGVKYDKVPPPVAKKPLQSNINPSPSLPNSLAKMELNVKGNGAIGEHLSGINPSETTTTRVTADTIETLF